jgi:hypothetical protein
MIEKQRTTRRTPDEEAEFWDAHDFTDCQDEFDPIQVRFMKNLSQGITVRLDPGTLSLLRSLAKEKGIGPSVMVRMWIMEHLTEMQTSRKSRGST